MKENHKLCKACGTVKHYWMFDKSDNSTDGYFPFCIACTTELKANQIKRHNKYRGITNE